MEEDVRPPQRERLGGEAQSLVQHDATQRPQNRLPEQQAPRKRVPISSVNQRTSASPFNRLPRTVIERILYVADASTFASLALLNRKWRRISDSPLLYAHQLSLCPSFALSQKATEDGPTQPDDLIFLKRQFFSEIRRNGFDVFFRPHQTLIKLISTSMSSSTAFPHGEAFRFAFSQDAQLILCISSSRIIVLDVASEPAAVKHELKTSRRPLHATILDDGSLLAVVSSSHQVNIYNLSSTEARLIQNLKLNDVPRALAFSPTGGVLAIAYDDMIEVYAIGERALATERRAVRCTGVDSISFSSDGVILLGSSDDPRVGNLVTITVPLYGEPDADFSVKDVQIQMWTTQILFPDTVNNYSLACLLPLHTEGEGSWILGFDNQLGAYRAIGVNNSGTGTAYFVSPTLEDGLELPPMMLASSDSQGELVALGFQNSGIWVYGLPDRLDIAPVAQTSGDLQIRPGSRETRSTDITDLRTNLGRLQRTITRPKVLIKGHRVTDMPGVTAARFVRHNNSMGEQRRLAAVAPGGVDRAMFGEEDVPLDGGRVLLLDFARSVTNGGFTELIIEIGEAEPKLLREPNSSLDVEVELERRRTRLHRGNSAAVMRREARESYPAASSSSRGRPRRNSFYLSPASSEVGEGEIPAIPDSPYDNTQPRSQDTLRRAATAAAASRRRAVNEPRHVYPETPVPPIFQIPHESDADNWVPPPPPYTREPTAPLPDYLRRTLLPPPTGRTRASSNTAETIRRSLSTRFLTDSSSRPSLHRLNTVTGQSLASRMRRQEGDPSPPDNPRRHASFLRRRETSNPGTTQQLGGVNESTTAPQQSSNTFVSHPPVQNAALAVPNPSFVPPSVPSVPSVPVMAAPIQPPPPTAHVEPVAGQLPNNNVMPSVPMNPPAMNNYLYSLSSPNLVESPELLQETQMHQASLRPHERSQSHNVRNPFSAIALRNRRASTDPTHSSSQSVAPEQQWRRRIEEWNERTIYERSKKSRSKCAVM
ncbi:F-box domain protein [Aspergillus lucknowensis]|uniref:F-box domain-containing protein n=1 Tax=Aspergillus lucknowensis TaxID=176173 RepID=A0ABR4LU27_9EURO